MSIDKLNQIASGIAEQKKKLAEFARTEGKQAIAAAFAPCFEPPTSLVRIEVVGYTPHFNDGDACTYSVHDPILVVEIDGEEEEIDTWGLERHSDDVQKLGQKTVDAFNKIWPIEDEIWLAVFGDHAKTTITKDEVTVEEYDHD